MARLGAIRGDLGRNRWLLPNGMGILIAIPIFRVIGRGYARASAPFSPAFKQWLARHREARDADPWLSTFLA
jgi:hypothetical protein